MYICIHYLIVPVMKLCSKFYSLSICWQISFWCVTSVNIKVIYKLKMHNRCTIEYIHNSDNSIYSQLTESLTSSDADYAMKTTGYNMYNNGWSVIRAHLHSECVIHSEPQGGPSWRVCFSTPFTLFCVIACHGWGLCAYMYMEYRQQNVCGAWIES